MTYAGRWWLDGDGKKLVSGPPMPFEIPEGYKSGFVELEMGLNDL